MQAGLVWFDWVVLLLIGVSTLISLKRGFFRESLSLLAWVAAFIIAVVLHEALETVFQPYIESPSLRRAVAIVSLFVLTLLIGSMVIFVISRLVTMTGLSGMDRLLGMVFGALRGVVLVVVLLMLGQYLLPLQQESWWQQSLLVPHFLRLEGWVVMFAGEIRTAVQPLFESGVQ